jgi:hypothetical protein
MGDSHDSSQFDPDAPLNSAVATKLAFPDGSMTASGLRRESARRTRQAILPTIPLVFGLPEAEAAVSIGVSPTKFRELVAAGTMPAARVVGGKLVYDIDELRLAFKSLPHQGGDVEVDTWADVISEG